MTGGRPVTYGRRDEERVTASCVIDGDKHYVTLDVTALLNLRAFAQLVRREAHASWCWRVLQQNESGKGLVADATQDLRRALGDRLVIQLDREEAFELVSDLSIASVEPERCPGLPDDPCDGAQYATEYDPLTNRSLCPAHLVKVQP